MQQTSALQNIFSVAKLKFPQVDLQILNPELSLSQNMQMIICQLEQPSRTQVRSEISNMKNAVDRQELKIQTSLINDENFDLNGRQGRRENEVEEEGLGFEMEFEVLGGVSVMCRQTVEEIWMQEQEEPDWFQN